MQALRPLSGQTAQEAAVAGQVGDSFGSFVITASGNDLPIPGGRDGALGTAADVVQGFGGVQTVSLSTAITFSLYGAGATLTSAGIVAFGPAVLAGFGGAEIGLAIDNLFERVVGNSIGSILFDVLNADNLSCR